MRVELWPDGSGRSTGGPIGWGWVLLAINDDGEVVQTTHGGGCAEEGSNNRAELMAVIDGLRRVKRGATVIVKSDSAYVVNAFTDGYLVRWEQNGWRKLTDGGEVKNADLWQLLSVEVNLRSVTFRLVKGHSGLEHNERADKIAGACRLVMKEQLEEMEDEALAASGT